MLEAQHSSVTGDGVHFIEVSNMASGWVLAMKHLLALSSRVGVQAFEEDTVTDVHS